jgi:hypothetical protein
LTEEEYLKACVEVRAKIAEAIQEYVSLGAEYSLNNVDSDHYGLQPHAHMLSDAVVCYQSVCLVREDGKPGYLINYFSVTDGTVASDFGVVCAAYGQMSDDL